MHERDAHEVELGPIGIAAANGLCTRQTMNPANSDTNAISTSQGLLTLVWK